MNTITASVLYRPETEQQKFLPEGPYPVPDGRLSWVAIQHGADAKFGSLNLLDLNSGKNVCYPLPGRPGFAFPTSRPGVFVIGMERHVVLFDTGTQAVNPISTEVDASVSGTIINDGMVWQDQLIFGCKDVKFAEQKAGLYLLRPGQAEPVQLRSDQTCSNGKAVAVRGDGQHVLYDICSKTQQVVSWNLDLAAGRVSDRRVIVDLTKEGVFPDGMILSPDGRSVIVALYDPRDREIGEARQYAIATGEVETVWQCPGSPRVTCPQLIRHQGGVKLVLTTADEGMPAELRARCANVGALFIAPTDFAKPCDSPPYPLGG
ncbi:MAG: SMP-30/gluconolactonase/LRE family protein [Pirellulales bacterium]